MRLASIAYRPRTGFHASAPGLMLLLTVGCGPAATAPSSIEATAATSATTIATASPGPSASATVPAGFPLMPGSEAVASLPDDPRLVARWTSAADGAQVYAFFAEALPAAGFHVDQLAPGGEAAIITFSAPGSAQLALSLTAHGDGTRIDLRLPDAASE